MNEVLVLLGLLVAFYGGVFVEANRRKVEFEQDEPRRISPRVRSDGYQGCGSMRYYASSSYVRPAEVPNDKEKS